MVLHQTIRELESEYIQNGFVYFAEIILDAQFSQAIFHFVGAK